MSLFFISLLAIASCSQNLVLVGKTGAGKSTLFNNMVGREVAAVGIGHIGTTDLQGLPLSSSITIWDTPGFFDSHISPIKILKDIENIGQINRILLTLKTPALFGRQGVFPDMEVVDFVYAAVGQQFWRDNVLMVFTFAQWENAEGLNQVKQVFEAQLASKSIPLPAGITFAGDEIEKFPKSFSSFSAEAKDIRLTTALREFRFRSIDSALLDERGVSDLERENRRRADIERERIRQHQAAIEAARVENERLQRERLQAEHQRQQRIAKMEKDRIEAEQRSKRLQKQQEEALVRAQLEIRVQEARTRLAQEDHLSSQWEPGIVTGLAEIEDFRRRYRRMTRNQQQAALDAHPAKPILISWFGILESWSVPEDLIQFVQ